MSGIHHILKKYWGYDSFRPLQEEIIQSVLSGEDTLALLPTGGGKSICFQVPALEQEGVCLVVSPLIALMKDQVANLQQRDIPAAALVSGMSAREVDMILDNCIYGKIKFLYLSPERLQSDLVRARIEQMKVNLLAVDEAHCISQWGYDFRPEYLKIAEIRSLIPNTPVLALTASATSEVVDDIQHQLQFKEPLVYRKSFARENLSYLVMKVEDKLGKLLEVASKVKGSGVVYVRNRKTTRDIAQYLIKHRISASYYHGGLDAQQRNSRQEAWLEGKSRVMVSTNAFGMGIDKPDVRFVIHYDLPDSLEAYYQEAGRAGRDEKPAYCVLLYHESDRLDLLGRMQMNFPEEQEIKRTYQALGNHYNLAVGAGYQQTFDFNLVAFSQAFSLKPMVVFSSLKILNQEGLIHITESLFQPSRVNFTVNSYDLYQFQIAHQQFDALIKVVLRSYGGAFDQYVTIDEKELAQRVNNSVEEVRKLLRKLHQLSIIDYQEQTNNPQLTFLQPRVHDKEITFDQAMLSSRKQTWQRQIDSVIQYATSTDQCRSQLILHYFDEKDVEPCGQCDICRDAKKLKLSQQEFLALQQMIKSILKQQELTPNSLLDKIPSHPSGQVREVLSWLLDNGQVLHKEGNTLSWKD